MMMTDDEIRGSMRKAADKRAQVGILAELNACSEAEVRTKLEQLGIAAPAKKPKAWKFDTDRARQLLTEGRTDLEAAEMLGISKQTFGAWRRAMKIPVNPEPRRPAKAKQAAPGPAPAVPAEPAGTMAPANDAPALCGPAEVVPAWAVTVDGRPALYLSRRELADAVQAIIDLDVELRRCRDGKDDH